MFHILFHILFIGSWWYVTMFVSLILCWAKLVCRSNTLKVWQTNLFQAINLLHFTRISTSHGITHHECRKMAHLNKSINKLFRRLGPTWWYLHFPIVAVSNQRDMSPWPRNPKFWPENCKTSGCPSSSTPPAFQEVSMPREGLNTKSHSELQEHLKAKFRYAWGQLIENRITSC